MAQPKELSFQVFPPGPLHKKRKFAVARFMVAPPEFNDKSAEWILSQEKPEPTSRRSMQQSAQQQQALLLSRHKGGQGPQRGVPETSAGGGSRYFVLMKTGEDFTAFPVHQSFNFRPVVRRETTMTLDQAEAAMNNPGLERSLAPRSLAASEAADTLETAQNAEFRALATENHINMLFDDTRPGSPKRMRGGDDMEGLSDYDEDEVGTSGRGRRGGRGGGRGRRGAGGDGSGDEALPEDEVVEDIYQGEEDELRPQAPSEAAQWEHEEAPDDDDLDQGGGDDEFNEDDPGLRKKLGIEDDEEEEEEQTEDTDKRALEEALEKERKRGDGDEEGGVGDELLEEEADMLEDAEGDVDAEDLDAMAAGHDADLALPQNGRTPGGSRERSPAPASLRGAAPRPPGTGRAPTPPPSSRTPTPTPAQRATPPPEGAPKRKAGGTPGSADAAAAPKRPRAATPPQRGATPPPDGTSKAPAAPQRAAAGGAEGVPTQEEVRSVLASGPIALTELMGRFSRRLVTADHKQAFKKLILSVGMTVEWPAGSGQKKLALKGWKPPG